MNDSRWSSANIPLRSGLGAREQGTVVVGGSNGAVGMNAGSGGGVAGGSFVGLTNGESGILRKTGGMGGHHHHHGGYGGQDNFADLLVFGYSCKMFRDDEKARFIDQGRHLIPWMGDNQLKIDRYDARGALHDLSQHEPPIGGYGNRLDCLSPAEQRAEQLCEEERYHSLYANEVEEEIYQEEAAKRLAAAGAEIAFNYDDTTATDGATVGPEPSGEPVLGADDDDSSDPPYIVPANFDVPVDLDLPETMKEHAIIEKTAKFIASQDSQMEILLRAKQAGNAQFNFLSPGGRLYRYYRHVLMAIKTNRYPEDVPDEEPNGTEAEDPSADAAELIPEKPKVIVPAIKYKPSVDCAYTQLISKITGAPIPTKSSTDSTDEESTPTAPVNPTQLTSLTSDFDYYPEEKSVEVKKVSSGLAGLVQYDSDSEDSTHEEEDKKEKEKKLEPEMERREITFVGKLPPEIFQHVIEKTATYVAKNGYSFEEALRTKNDPRFLFLKKDHEFYPFYAFRVRYLINPFEEVPRSPEKVTITREIENGTVVETPSIGIKTVNTAPVPVPAPPSQIQATKPGGAVCFSIKSKDDASVALKSNVMQELGGDEEEVEEKVAQEKEKERSKSRSKSPAVSRDPHSPVPKEEPAAVESAVEERVETPPLPVTLPTEDSRRSSTPPLEDSKPQQIAADGDDAASKDQKRLEERIKDKLAVAAREKLALITKEKQLQLERKKRASMFLSLINKAEPAKVVEEEEPIEVAAATDTEDVKEDSPLPATPPLAPNKNGLELLKNQFSDEEEEEEDGGNSSDISIHSIPSQSDSPVSNRVPSSADDDVVLVEDDEQVGGRPSRSRTRSRSLSSNNKSKKKKHKHKSKSKKSKKKKSKSRSRSRSRSKSKVKSKRKRSRSRSRSKSSRRSRSASYSEKDPKKKKKSKKKSHKRHKSSRSSSSSRHHQKEHKEKPERENDYY